MKNILIIAVILLVEVQPPQVSAQSTFQKTYGMVGSDDEARSLIATKDSGFIMAGSGNAQIYLVKTDKDGNTQWAKTYGDATVCQGWSIVQTTDGGYAVAGTYNYGPTADVCLLKIDSLGIIQWFSKYGGSSYEYGYSVKQTFDGGYIITGITKSFGMTFGTAFIIKTDHGGDTLWTRIYDGGYSSYAFSVLQLADSTYIVCGSIGMIGYGSNVLLMAIDQSGGEIWSETYGGTGNDEGYSVEQTDDKGFIIAGYTESFGAGGSDNYLIKTDSAGNLSWSKAFGGAGYDYCEQAQPAANGYILTGSYNNMSSADVLIVRTDANGDTLWINTFGDNGADIDYGSDVLGVNDGFVIAGYALGFSSSREFYLVKTDSLGSSGCNENHPVITVTTPATVETSPTIQVSSTATAVNSPVITATNAGSDSTLCFSANLPPIAKIAGNSHEICAGWGIIFADSSANDPTSWKWLFPGGSPLSANIQNPTILYNSQGVYEVTLIAINANGSDTLTLSNYITVYPLPPKPTISQNGPTLTSSAASGNQWYLDSAIIPSATSQAYAVTQNGVYSVTVTDANGCSSTSDTLSVMDVGIDEIPDKSDLKLIKVNDVFGREMRGEIPAGVYFYQYEYRDKILVKRKLILR